MLDSIDPGWLWPIGGVLLLIAEVIAPGFFLVFIGAAALTACSPSCSVLDLATAGLFSSMRARVLIGQPLVRGPPTAPIRCSTIAGAAGRPSVTVVADVDDHGGQVRVGDSEWSARGGPAAPGDRSGSRGRRQLPDRRTSERTPPLRNAEPLERTDDQPFPPRGACGPCPNCPAFVTSAGIGPDRHRAGGGRATKRMRCSIRSPRTCFISPKVPTARHRQGERGGLRSRLADRSGIGQQRVAQILRADLARAEGDRHLGAVSFDPDQRRGCAQRLCDRARGLRLPTATSPSAAGAIRPTS